MYSCVPPPGDNIPVAIEPFKVKDSVPENGGIEWAVKRLRNNRSGWPSQIQAEHIKGWLAAAKRAEKGDTAAAEGDKRAMGTEKGGPVDPQEGADNWTRSVDLIQTAFREGEIAEEGTWQAVVLIPKGKKDYRGHRPRRGDVEGSGGKFKSPFHSLHHLP